MTEALDHLLGTADLQLEGIGDRTIYVITIRPERPEDAAAVRHVNELAFGQPRPLAASRRARSASGIVGILLTP